MTEGNTGGTGTASSSDGSSDSSIVLVAQGIAEGPDPGPVQATAMFDAGTVPGFEEQAAALIPPPTTAIGGIPRGGFSPFATAML